MVKLQHTNTNTYKFREIECAMPDGTNISVMQKNRK